MALIWLIIVLALLIATPVIAWKLCFPAFKKSLNKAAAVILSLVGTVALSIYFFGLEIDCYTSYQLHKQANRLLSESELKTLSPSSFICPTVYTFTRNEQRTCLLMLGDEVGVGCG